MGGKIWVEASLISARGVRRSSSLWKRQWFAVGWIDPNNKYCTNVAKDGSGNANPTWKTKFATLLDDTNFQDMALTVEVYSREPIFLRESLEGTATILLKEFLAKYSSKKNSSSSSGSEEVGSYQLRKRNSNKPQGFVDVSIRISEEREEPSSYLATGGDEGIIPIGHGNNPEHGVYPRELSPLGPSWKPQHRPGTNGGGGLPIDHGKSTGQMAYPRDKPPLAPFRQPQYASSNSEYTNHVPYPAANHPIPSMGQPSYPPPVHRTVTPPPPPPPANVGYIPTFLPNSEYINMPASAAPTRGGAARPSAAGVAMGAGVGGALAAGAVIFGDDFMSGFSIPSSLPDPSLTISMDPTF
ncbi:unnamed protein product [Linum trigynum]|uniref:C2 domain-containing protein n=1 Tax=Linum trigynum TaxID=586398 RepID=A0AAV2F3Q5_9ROSI